MKKKRGLKTETEIRAASDADIVTLFERGGTEWDSRKSRPAIGDYWARCPFHAEKRASLHVMAPRGSFWCFGCGEHGGAIKAAQLLFGLPFPRAVEFLLGTDTEPDPEVIEAREQRRRELDAQAKRERIARCAVAVELYAAATPIAGTLGDQYLRQTRAIQAALGGAELRFHPRAPLSPYDPSKSGRRPAIVAAIRNAACDHIGSHVEFLRPDGGGKADLPHLEGSRLVVGAPGGGFIRLGRVRDAAVIGEGVETTLSASEACGLPGLAAINAANMRALVLPDSVRRVLIAYDRDLKRAGQLSAEALAERLDSEGRAVAFYPPPSAFKDWNDAAQAGACLFRPEARNVA